jgi:autotransporter-associated beta strand protein
MSSNKHLRQPSFGWPVAFSLICIFTLPRAILADVADLDKGHRILLERGLQIHAMAVDQPEIPNWSVFDAGGWNGIDFQFNYFGPQGYLGPAPGNHVWQATYADYSHTSFSAAEAPYSSNCVRIQLDDEQDLNNATVRANVAAWFAAARANYPDTILSINQIPFAATDANFRDFMTSSQPDMLMIDSYRWTSDPAQGSWNLLSDWQRHRKFALSGNDGTGAHPIPYGFYAQAIDDYGRVPSESELRFEHFAAWAMGYTMTDDFTYNTADAYSGVESIYFANGAQQANPTPSYYQVQSINSEGKKLGPALVRLLSTDVRFINGYNSSGSQNPNPIDIPNWSIGAGDSFLRSYSRVNVGTKNNGYAGDVLLSWFKPLDESLDSTLYSNVRYFAVTNGLTDPTGSAADCRQLIALGYDFGTTGIKSLQRLRRDTGTVEVVPLTFDVQSGQYVLNVTLDGGTANLFKFNDGSPFVGIPAAGLLYWDSDNAATGNDATTGTGLGGSGIWNSSSSQWYRNGINNDAATATNDVHSAVANAVFWGTAGTVTLGEPLTINALTFKTSGYTITGSTLTLTSSFVTVDSGVSATISSDVAGFVGLTKTGAGTLNLAGPKSYSGGTIINGGVLGIASSSFAAEPVSPTTDIGVNNGSTLRFNGGGITLSANRNISLGTGGGVFDTNGNMATIAGVVSGTALTKTGTGTLILSGVNTYSTGTIVNGGTLQISSDANLGAAPAAFTVGNITLDGGTLRFGGNFDLSNNRGITLGAGSGTIDTQGFTNPTGYTQPNGIQGNGNLTKIGSGTFFMNPTPSNQLNHNWKGNLILEEGTWKISERGGLPYNTNDDLVYRPGQVTFDGGTLQIAATISVSSLQRGITIAAGGGTFDTQSFNFTWGGPVIGSSTSAVFNKIGSGQLQFNTSSVAPGSYAGNFNVNGGTVVLNGGAAMGDLAAVNLASAAGVGLTISGVAETIGSLAGGGATGGSLSLFSNLVTGGNNNSTIFSGLVSGSGGLTKTGTGTFTLARSAGNTYTGTTTIAGGTLRVNNSTGSGTGTGSVVVNAGAVLGGTGTIAGAVTVTSGAHIAPGASIESLDVGSLSLAAGSILDFELDTVLGIDTSDLVNVTATNGLTINGGTLNLANVGGMTFGTYTLIDYSGTLNGSFSNLALGTAPAGFNYSLVNNASNKSIDLFVTPLGDFNHDGTVEGADYVVWRKSFGAPYTLADYDMWRAHFGETVFSGAASTIRAVPEPRTLSLVLLTTLGLVGLRRGPVKVRMLDVANSLTYNLPE